MDTISKVSHNTMNKKKRLIQCCLK